MSKILKRPMFRGGGKVSSYGNGIASGLADGGMPGKRGLVDGPGGYAGEYKFGETPAARGLGYLNNEFNKMLAAGYDLGAVPLNTLGRAFGYNPGFSGTKFMDSMTQGNFTKNNPKLDPDKASFFLETDAKKGFTLPSMQPEKKVEEEVEVEGDGKTDTERRLEMEKNELKKLLDSFGGSKKEDTEDEALAAIEKKQKLLEKVMGGGKSARIADASDMALNYASKALGEEATVKSSFADFFADESKRPSRSQKVKDAAANAAIQAYLTEKISEKDFNKQMALITGQAQIKQKFADAAKSNLTVQDYVTARGASVSKSEAIENGARGIVENNDEYKSFEKIDSKDNVPELLVEENIGVVFLDNKTKEVFVVTVLEDGTVGKKVLYN